MWAKLARADDSNWLVTAAVAVIEVTRSILIPGAKEELRLAKEYNTMTPFSATPWVAQSIIKYKGSIRLYKTTNFFHKYSLYQSAISGRYINLYSSRRCPLQRKLQEIPWGRGREASKS